MSSIKTTAIFENRKDIFWLFIFSFVGLFQGKFSISVNQDLDELVKDIAKALADQPAPPTNT